MSVILASRFGGTPWQWRQEADERDWGTAINMLMQEIEEVNSHGT